MRKIKFRGRRIDNGEWVYGHLNYSDQQDRYYIGVTEIMHPVDPKTVGQFTGLVDRNEKEIYEGDIVRDECGQVNEIKFHYGSFWFNWLEMPHYMDQVEKGEVIGNIHENPELIEPHPKPAGE